MQDLDKARSVLRERFGHAEFRPGQAEIVSAVLNGRDVLAVLPTGSGKSLLYQLPALLMPSLTLVVSPLVSLMRDQVHSLAALGIPAAALHSAAEPHETVEVLARLRSGTLKLLYVAPERLDLPDMAAMLRAARPRVMAVDEAHCVAHWGHEFRPEYSHLRKAADAIGIRQIVAVTATAAPMTRAEIVSSLFRAPPDVFSGSFSRPNLTHRVERRQGGPRQIFDFLASHSGQSGIVYCATREKTDRIARQLQQGGVDAFAYHAGLDGGTRHAHQDEFISRPGVVMVATIAFGMGIDKADVRFICHADLPSSMETYYQETGRAGRDGLPAETLLLYDAHDFAARRAWLPDAAEPERQREAAFKLTLLEQFCRSSACRQQTLLRALGDESRPCGRCDNCRRGLMRVRQIAELPATGIGRARAAMVRMCEAIVSRGADVHEDTQDVVAATVHPPVERSSGLTVAQHRALLRMKAARLAVARRQRCSPFSIVSDAALQAIAKTAPATPEATRIALAEHEIDDHVFAHRIFEALRQELEPS